jgi:hypothetical protein
MANRLPGPTIPIGCVVLIAFLAMPLPALTLVAITYILVGMIDATRKWNGCIIRAGSFQNPR